MANTAVIDTLRSLNFVGISASYAAVGSAFTHSTRVICLTNNTNGDLLVSTDGVTDQLIVPALSFKLFDLTTNKAVSNSEWVFPVGMQIFVKQSTSATSGDFYVECIYPTGE